jgi:hypothetical protein
MKRTIKGFLCSDEVKLLIGDTHEMVLFLQTACASAGIDPDVEDLDELVSTLDEQVKVRFSKELWVSAVDLDTMTPANKKSEDIILAITPIEDITVH